MRKIKAPCPGCGTPDLIRKSIEVCWDCKDLLHAGQIAVEAAKEHKSNIYRVPPFDAVPWRSAKVVRYLSERDAGEDGVGASEDIQTTFWNLIHCLGKPVGYVPNETPDLVEPGYVNRHGSHEGFIAIEVDERIPPLAQALFEALQAYSKAIYHDGLRDGQNLLVQIASGPMSIERINELSCDE